MKVTRVLFALAFVFCVVAITGVADAAQKFKSAPIPQEELDAALSTEDDNGDVVISSPREGTATTEDATVLSYKVTVKNLTPWWVKLYGDGRYVTTIPPYYKIWFRVHKARHTAYAVCCCAHWGPVHSRLKPYVNNVWILR